MQSTLKSILSAVIILFVSLVLVEGAVFLIYRPAVPEAVETDELEGVDSLDVQSGRKKAGLGFRDPGMALHPYLGYVYLPKNRRSPDNPGHPEISVSRRPSEWTAIQ